MDKYRVVRVLGEGAFGKVLEATNYQNNDRVAVKQIKSNFKSWKGPLSPLARGYQSLMGHTDGPECQRLPFPSELTFYTT